MKPIFKGDTVLLKFIFNDDTGEPHDFTGQELNIIIYHKKSKKEILEEALEIRDNIGYLTLTKDITSEMMGNYEYYIRITNGIYSTIIETGEIEVIFSPEFDGVLN